MAERLLHIVGSQAVAGAENHLFTLLPGLAESGCAVRLLNLERPGDVQPLYLERLAEIERRGVEVIRARIGHRFDPRGAWRVAREVRQWRPTIVHTHMIVADLLGSYGAWLAGAPLRIASRHRDYGFSDLERGKFRRYYRVAGRAIHAHIAISEQVQRLILQEERLAPSAVFHVPYGIDDQRVGKEAATARIRAEWQVPAGVPLLGTVARLIDWKGHRYALDAARRLADEGVDFRWAFVGDGPLRADLNAEIAASGLAARVFITGFRSDIPDIMAGLDVLVHPTTGEGFGLITLEAMVQSTPLVVSRTGAMPEIVEEGISGWFFPNRDGAALASTLRVALASEAGRRAVGEAGRRRFETHFTARRMVDRTLDAYDAARLTVNAGR